MFGRSYFGGAYFGPRYWGSGGTAPPPIPGVTLDGSGLRFLRRKKQPRLAPEEIERQQRMVQEYLDELDRKKREAEKQPHVPARKAKKALQARQAAVPVLSEAVARVASETQLKRIVEHAQAEKRAREIARAEFERRYWAAFVELALADD